ncbi:hypothetical protein IV203_023886 [Nitzschia inconspicua]|uniref:Uncharacterized protein n=1 Tax=Nitzschia inconspicua TaxID=303405 RepID=A0A9K3KB80_9STRA|nr:hypothetical protein IV203_023886 [Nitzschia inconspicua]
MPDHADEDSNFDAEEAVRVIRTNTISKKSRDVYDGSIAQMLKWFYDNKRHLLTEQFIQYGITYGFAKADIRRFLADAPSNAPVKFEDFNVQDFMEWIVSVRKEDGSTPTYSTYNCRRAGLFNLFRDYKQDIAPLQSELKTHFRGLQRTKTQALANGEGRRRLAKMRWNLPSPEVIRGVIDEIEKRAMTAGTVTRDGLEAMINGCLENSALYQLVLTLKNSPTPAIQQEETLTGDEAGTMTPMWGSHIWGGPIHPVPQDFTFPNSCSQIAWQYWMCGDRQKRYPPLRNLSRDDMPSTNMRKRLSDLRYLMQLVEKRVEEQGKWIANPSIEQANEMFEVGKDVLDISDVSEKGRKRRGLQMKWTSMVTQVRNKRNSHRTS